MTDYNQVPQPQQPYGAPAPATDIPAPAGAYYGAPSAQTAAGGVQLDAYGNPIVAASAPAVGYDPNAYAAQQGYGAYPPAAPAQPSPIGALFDFGFKQSFALTGAKLANLTITVTAIFTWLICAGAAANTKSVAVFFSTNIYGGYGSDSNGFVAFLISLLLGFLPTVAVIVLGRLFVENVVANVKQEQVASETLELLRQAK
jgi:hypothetical protein